MTMKISGLKIQQQLTTNLHSMLLSISDLCQPRDIHLLFNILKVDLTLIKEDLLQTNIQRKTKEVINLRSIAQVLWCQNTRHRKRFWDHKANKYHCLKIKLNINSSKINLFNNSSSNIQFLNYHRFTLMVHVNQFAKLTNSINNNKELIQMVAFSSMTLR